MTIGDALGTEGKRPELYGVGGWLTFLCVSLLIFTPLAAIREIATTLINQSMDSIGKAFALGFVIFILGFAVFSGIGLVRLWPRAVVVAKGYFFFGLAMGLLMMLAVVMGEASAVDTINGLQSIAVSAAWLGYLFRSERVRNTYGKNSVRDAAEVFR